MKLLFDQNLSHHLIYLLADRFPDCQHVRLIGYQEATDTEIWNCALEHGYAIVSKDADFHQRSLLLGHPPKVIWLTVGNCSTRQIATLLTHHQETVHKFLNNEVASVLLLS
ncbi:MAG: DUF5615 family PIN-like protein [Anaerolineales bacterium]|nr:DUF5615 family PIN-like protein [Anaerolineales bacterium]MCB9128107.1 DUF5615 family PIN-like protein [Ardenticatenales bacterium]MCB9171820.1 DUF5615 family PIN-like protein [Ardenticatenales bacterium]